MLHYNFKCQAQFEISGLFFSVFCLFALGKVPLAESKCQAKRRGRHGPAVQDHGGRHRGKPQEEIHGRLYFCILRTKASGDTSEKIFNYFNLEISETAGVSNKINFYF